MGSACIAEENGEKRIKIVVMPDCWLEVSTRKVLRQTT